MAPHLPTDSPLPGATWRPLAPRDAEALERVIEAARVQDGGQEVRTGDDVLRELTDARAPASTNTLGLVLHDGSLAGWAIVHERFGASLARRVFLDGDTHPTVRGRGIGTQLLRWAIARGEETLAARPADLPRYLEAFRDVTANGAVALHVEHGFTTVRQYVDMQRDLTAALPAEAAVAGIRIVPYQPAHAEAVRRAHNDAFADHWSSEPVSPDDWERDETDEAQEVFQLVDQLVDAGRGVVAVAHAPAATAFRAAGMDAASLGVDTENPTGAVGLYERVGFTVNRRFVRLRRVVAD